MVLEPWPAAWRVVKATFVIYRRRFGPRNQRWRWRLVAENGRKIANGGEGYANRSECEAMGVNVVAGHYRSAVSPPPGVGGA